MTTDFYKQDLGSQLEEETLRLRGAERCYAFFTIWTYAAQGAYFALAAWSSAALALAAPTPSSGWGGASALLAPPPAAALWATQSLFELTTGCRRVRARAPSRDAVTRRAVLPARRLLTLTPALERVYGVAGGRRGATKGARSQKMPLCALVCHASSSRSQPARDGDGVVRDLAGAREGRQEHGEPGDGGRLPHAQRHRLRGRDIEIGVAHKVCSLSEQRRVTAVRPPDCLMHTTVTVFAVVTKRWRGA